MTPLNELKKQMCQTVVKFGESRTTVLMKEEYTGHVLSNSFIQIKMINISFCDFFNFGYIRAIAWDFQQ